MTDCPIDGCPTAVQRSVNGTLANGLALHLRTVHRLAESQANELAERWVTQ